MSVHPKLHHIAIADDPLARVVILPHAGGSASYFRGWHNAAKQLGFDLDAVQYPGHEELFTEKSAECLDELAEAVTELIRPEVARTVIFGHSMGGLLAHRVATMLAGNQMRPLGLHISGTRAPNQQVRNARHVLPDRELVHSIGRMNPDVENPLEDDLLAAVLLPQVRHEMFLAETHQMAPLPLDYPIYAHVGDRDPDFTTADAPAWYQFSTAGSEAIIHSGHHFYLADQAWEVLASIRDRLDLTQGQSDLARPIYQSRPPEDNYE